MEAARPGGQRQRTRRGTVDRPLNTRLVRVAALVLVPALLAFLFSISTTSALPRPSLEPLFDASSAGSLATELSTVFPAREPGSIGGENAALWYSETMASLGLTTEEDVWTADLADLGEVTLRNLVTVIPGQSTETILLVAHRDNKGIARPSGDNASGTAALLEIGRGYALPSSGSIARPRRTLVLVSTDAGAYGGGGAARFVATSPLAESALAAVVLDGIGGRGLPRLGIAGNGSTSSSRTLVTTAAEYVEEQTGERPALPSGLTQLVDLAVPLAVGEQGPFQAAGIAAISLTTDEPGDPHVPAGDEPGSLHTPRLGALGRSTEALVDSIDGSVGATFRTTDSLFLGERSASGWTVRLLLVVAIVPFVLGVLDLLVRQRRRRLPLRPAARALVTRALVALYLVALVVVGAVAAVFPTGESLPLPPDTNVVTDRPVIGLTALGVAFGLGWLLFRRRLVSDRTSTAEERLAGYAAALAWLAALSVATVVVKPYGLVFLLPSLYAWLWMPLVSGLWPRLAVYLAGLLGPIGALVLLSQELGIGILDVPLYLASLWTVGYVSTTSVLLAAAWLAASAQLGALATGRYAPHTPTERRGRLLDLVRLRQTTR